MSTSTTITCTVFLSSVLLTSCGGGSSGGASDNQPPDNTSCEEREYFNDTVGLPAAYFNGHIPISSQLPQGTLTLDTVYDYDMDARRITVTESNSLTPGTTTTSYELDEQGRPSTRNGRVVNFAIQLNDALPQLRYSYDSDGLLTGYTVHSVDDQGVASSALSEVTLEWSDVGGVSTSVNSGTATGDLVTSTTTYTYDCTRVRTATIESEYRSQPDVVQNYTIETTGSGKAVSTFTTLVGAGVAAKVLRFDSAGNVIDRAGETINYETTDEQIVNIELFENAIRYYGLL